MSDDALRHDRLEIGRDPESPRALEQAVEVGHEADVVRSRVLWIAAAIFIGLGTIGWFAVQLIEPLFISLQEEKYPPPNPLAATYGRVEPPAPRLQVDPRLDIHDYRAAQERLLTTYGWVDEQAGVVRIPIERAIDILAERGLPAVPVPASPPAPAARPEAPQAEQAGRAEQTGHAGEGAGAPALAPSEEAR